VQGRSPAGFADDHEERDPDVASIAMNASIPMNSSDIPTNGSCDW